MPDYFVHESSYVDETVPSVQVRTFGIFRTLCRAQTSGKIAISDKMCLSIITYILATVAKSKITSLSTRAFTWKMMFFCAPSCVFTNVYNPRAAVERKNEFLKTFVKRGTTVGANATIICGTTLGEYCFIGTGTVVTKDIPLYVCAVGNPARQVGWRCACGEKLHTALQCTRCGLCYRLSGDYLERCL